MTWQSARRGGMVTGQIDTCIRQLSLKTDNSGLRKEMCKKEIVDLSR